MQEALSGGGGRGDIFPHYCNFLLHKLNSCRKNYSREDTIRGNTVFVNDYLSSLWLEKTTGFFFIKVLPLAFLFLGLTGT